MGGPLLAMGHPRCLPPAMVKGDDANDDVQDAAGEGWDGVPIDGRFQRVRHQARPTCLVSATVRVTCM